MKIWIAMLMCATGAVNAQTVWRCGPDGRSYSDAPCRDGHGGRALALAEARPLADLHSAQDMARREKDLAEQLMRERQLREWQPASGAVAIRGALLTRSAADDVRRKSKGRGWAKHHAADAGTWRAVAPASRHGRD